MSETNIFFLPKAFQDSLPPLSSAPLHYFTHLPLELHPAAQPQPSPFFTQEESQNNIVDGRYRSGFDNEDYTDGQRFPREVFERIDNDNGPQAEYYNDWIMENLG
jgi:hypothetical protein